MSKASVGPFPVLEWSPSGCSVFDPTTGKITHFGSVAEASRFLSGEVILALGRRTSFIRTVRLPDAAKEDVSKVLALQIGQLFPLNPAEASVDFLLTGNKTSEGRLAVVAAVKTNLLKQVKAEMVAAGVRVRTIVPVAFGSALLAQELGKEECAVVRESTEGICIDVIHEGQLRASRVVPTGNDSARIEGEVCRSFGALRLPCAEAIAAAGFTYAGADVQTTKSDLSCLASTDVALNLELPEDVAKRQHRKVEQAKRLALLLWVSTLGASAVVWDQRSTDAALLAKGDRRWAKEISNLQKVKAQATTVATELGAVSTALKLGFEAKQPLGDVVKILTNEIPAGVWMTGLTVERGKPAQIRGTATNAAAVQRYLSALSQNDRFRDVKLIFANNGTIETTNVVQFSMSAHIIGNLPLVDPTIKKKVVKR